VAAQEPFADVLTANERYAERFRLGGLSGRAARGLAVLTCIDSRIEPLAMLGLQPGDAKIIRNAGGRATDEVVASLLVAVFLLGVERLMVVGHTGCRMTVAGDDVLRRAIGAAGGPDTSAVAFGAMPDRDAAVRADVELLRSRPELGRLEVGGFVYDVESGRLSRVA
jgi:carbonic anhydrase